MTNLTDTPAAKYHFKQRVSDLVSCPTDLVFVVDVDLNVAKFDLVKSFLSQFVVKLDINGGKARVGIVTYAKRVLTTINLNEHSDVGDLQTAIAELTRRGVGRVFTNKALRHVSQSVLQTAAGDRDNVPNLVVVLHHQESDDPYETEVSVQIRRRLQLRLNFDSIAIRQPFDGRGNIIRRTPLERLSNRSRIKIELSLNRTCNDYLLVCATDAWREP